MISQAYSEYRIESKVNDLRFYKSASWNDKDRAGSVNKGSGFPTVLSKLKVDGGEQYKVKNSDGNTYYITAHEKYVNLIKEEDDKLIMQIV